MRIQCSEVQDLQCIEQGRGTQSVCLLKQSSQLAVDYPCEPKQDKVSEL